MDAERERDMKYVKILDLGNGIVASRLESALRERNIPHLIRSMHDTAYNGIYQTIIGWGWVEAPEEEREKIAEIYADILKTWEPDERVETEQAIEQGEPEESAPEKADRARLGLILLVAFIVLLVLGILIAVISNSYGPRLRHRFDLTERQRQASLFTAEGRS